MKKYLLFLLVLTFIFGLFGFNTNFTSATGPYNEPGYVSGCITGDAFSRTTGQPCGGNTTPECRTGDLFSSVTGKPCSNNGGGIFCRVLFNQDFKIGSRGDDVKTFQQTLKDEGFLSGRVDGIYGRVTDGARINYYKRCPIPNPQSPVISGVSGPQSLNVNEQGTWSVTASDPSGGNLSYSVVWGDENYGVLNGTQRTDGAMVFEQSATFTHSYSQSKIYHPKFMVRNDAGVSAETSLSVNVGGVINTSSINVLSPNGGETWIKGTTQTIKWQDNGTTTCQTGTICNSPSYDIQLVSYSPPCTSNVCPMYALPAPRTIARGVYGSSYNWPIPNCTSSNPCSSNFEIGAGSYTIQVCRSGTDVCDSSNSYFKIVENGMVTS